MHNFTSGGEKVWLGMPFIFNYGSQSGRERGTDCTNSFQTENCSLLHQICLNSLHSWVGDRSRPWSPGLTRWKSPEGWGQGFLQTRLPCLRWDFLLNPGLGDLESVKGSRVLLPAPENALDCFLVQGSRQPSNDCDVALGVQFDYRGYRKEGISVGEGRPNHDRLRILVWWLFFVDEKEAQTLNLLVYRLLDVKFLREQEVRQRAVDNLVDFSAFFTLHGHRIGRKLQAMQHFEGIRLQIVPQHLVHGGFTLTGCGG